jgi:hypothetical protein
MMEVINTALQIFPIEIVEEIFEVARIIIEEEIVNPLGIRLGITAYRHAPILRSLLWQRPLLDARAQTIDVTYLIY